MKIAISSGHGKYIRGASGSPVPPQLDEVDEARRVVNRVAELWGESGVETYVFHDDTSHDQSTNLSNIVSHHNSSFGGSGHDLDVSVHFNAYDGSAHGVECLYVTQDDLASKVAQAIAQAGGFTNRGPKYRSDLYFLNNTREPSILIETCFCDNTGDSNAYRESFEKICQAIAESISGEEIPDEPNERPPAWPPAERPDFPDRPPSEEENRFVVTFQCYGDMVVLINGQAVLAGDDPENCPKITMDMACPEHGEDLTVVINGQEFHGPFEQAPPSGLQKDIFATYFGGSSDPNYSAYPPYDSQGNGVFLDDTSLYVAVPWNVTDAAQRERGVKVYNRASGRSAIGKIWEKGPWMVDDNYIETGTRPIAEQCYLERTPLPRGPNAGKIPSNPAGLDLSPALYHALGMTDNGPVDFQLIEEEEA